MSDLAGFWSYAHKDNENAGGRILGLADRLSEAYELLSGEPLLLFTDRKIGWGEEWEKRIDEELERTTFLIPLVTPSYFRHESCRKELLQFASAAKQFGVEQLLLPIYYVNVPELELDQLPKDEAMAIVKGTQWADARPVRLEDESSAKHRAFVDHLAQRLVEVAAQTESQPSNAPAGPLDRSALPVRIGGVQEDSAEEGDGYLELLVKGEEAMPKWVATVQGIAKELTEFGEITQQSVAEMRASSTDSFAARLAVANRLADKLDGPADRLESLGSEYSSRLFEVDPAIRTLLRFAHENVETRSDPEFRQFAEAISEMVETSLGAMEGVRQLSTLLGENAGFSRELRRPLRRIDGALRNMTDAQAILEEWASQIDDLPPDEEAS